MELQTRAKRQSAVTHAQRNGQKHKKNREDSQNQDSRNLKRLRSSTLQEKQAKTQTRKKKANAKTKKDNDSSQQQGVQSLGKNKASKKHQISKDKQAKQKQSKSNAKKTKKQNQKASKEQVEQKKFQRNKAEEKKNQSTSKITKKNENEAQKSSKIQAPIPAEKPNSKSKGYVYKPAKSKPKQKQESMNEIMRQYAKISRKKKRKSNFYLDKQDCLKWGEPVGRGSKKERQKLEERQKLQRQREKERKKNMKEMIKQLCQPFSKNERREPKIEQIQVIEDSQQIKYEQSKKTAAQAPLKQQPKAQDQRQAEKQQEGPIKTAQNSQNVKFEHQKDSCKAEQSCVQNLQKYLQNHIFYTWISQNIQAFSILHLRSQLKTIFQKILQLIEQHSPLKRKWQPLKKQLIIRQLLRQKDYNRLLNDETALQPALQKLMQSVSGESATNTITIDNADMQLLWTEFDSFVNTIELRSKEQYQSWLELRKNARVDKSDEKVGKNGFCRFFACQYLCELKDNHLLHQWKPEESKILIQLYTHLPFAEIQARLVSQLGQDEKWSNEQQIKMKINQLALKGLAMSYDLTKPIILSDQQKIISQPPVEHYLKDYLRGDRTCQLSVFANYCDLVLKLVEPDQQLVHGVKKKLMGLHLKSCRHDICQAIKSIHHLVKIDLLVLSSDIQSRKGNGQSSQKPELDDGALFSQSEGEGEQK